MARKTKQQQADHKNKIILGLGVLALVLATAGASAYITAQSMQEDSKPVVQKVKKQNNKIKWDESRVSPQPQQQVQPAPQRVACNDGNIVGKVAGGVGGGALASNIGKGSGKTAAVIGGTLGGAYLGGEYIPTHNVTCR